MISERVTIRSTCRAGVDPTVQSIRIRVYTGSMSAATKTVSTDGALGRLEGAIDLGF